MSKKWKARLWAVIALLAIAAIGRAQQPQTQTAPVFSTNAKYTNGVAPGYWPTAGSGLTLNLSKGTANCANTIVTYAGGTLTMTNSTTNYVYLDTTASCAPASNTSGFTNTTIPIGTVVTSGGAITSITDDRTFQTTSGINTASGIVALFSGCSGTEYLGADGACHSAAGGSVTSVAETVPGGFSISGSPITSSGTLALTVNPAGPDYVYTSTAANTGAWEQINGGASCGDSTHALNYVAASTHQFGCQALTGSGGGSLTGLVYSTQSSTSTGNISAVSMVASASAMHDYVFTWTVSLTAAGTGCTSGSPTTIEFDVIFTDPNASSSFTEKFTGILIATGNGTVGFATEGSDNILAKSGTAVQYQTANYTVGAGCTGNPTYQISPNLLQLW